MLNTVKGFIKGDPEREAIRGFACGVFFFEQNDWFIVAKNVSDLKRLFGRSKSSINDSFHRLGYAIISHPRTYLARLFPEFNNLPKNKKMQWTICRSPKPNADPVIPLPLPLETPDAAPEPILIMSDTLLIPLGTLHPISTAIPQPIANNPLTMPLEMPWSASETPQPPIHRSTSDAAPEANPANISDIEYIRDSWQ
jgi:hypothetical protein